MSQAGGTWPARLYRDGPITARIHYYKVPIDRDCLPVPNVFEPPTSIGYRWREQDTELADGECGAVGPWVRIRRNKPPVWAPLDVRFCGHPDAWMGGRPGIDPDIGGPFFGRPPCCLPPGMEEFLGLTLRRIPRATGTAWQLEDSRLNDPVSGPVECAGDLTVDGTVDGTGFAVDGVPGITAVLLGAVFSEGILTDDSGFGITLADLPLGLLVGTLTGDYLPVWDAEEEELVDSRVKDAPGLPVAVESPLDVDDELRLVLPGTPTYYGVDGVDTDEETTSRTTSVVSGGTLSATWSLLYRVGPAQAEAALTDDIIGTLPIGFRADAVRARGFVGADEGIDADGAGWIVRGGFVVGGDGTLTEEDIPDLSDTYLTPADADLAYDPLGAAGAEVDAHEAESNPHPQYLTPAEGDAAYDPLGAAGSAVSAHEGAANPHPQYLTPAEGDAAYAPIGSGYTDEQARDAAASILQNSAEIAWTFSDPGDTATPALVDGTIVNARLANRTGPVVLGRSPATSGPPTDIVPALAGQVMRYDGTALAFGAVDLASGNAVTNSLPPAKGGTGQTGATLGDLLYGSGTGTMGRLAGNATTTRKRLVQTGDGSVSAAPAWRDDTPLASELTGTRVEAYLTSNQGLTVSAWNTVQFDNETVDALGEFNPATYTFTPAVTGWYAVNCIVYITSAAARNIVTIWVGTASQVRTLADSPSLQVGAMTLLQLTGGTGYTFRTFPTAATATALGGASSTYLSIRRHY